MTPRPMFPHVVDSTIMATFRSCPQKAFRTYVEHWKPQYESVHLHAGAAFAKGIEVARKAYYEDQVPSEEAEALGLEALLTAYGMFEPPEGSAKTAERMAGALEFYFASYPLLEVGAVPITLASGKRGIEFAFAQPLPIDHPETGDPILLAGRADMLADFAGGVYLVDEKTTSSLGASWGRQWEMRSQFTGYTWAAKEALGIECAGTIVRGVSILKTKYDTMEVITNRSPYEVERWLSQTVRDVKRMIDCWKEGYWDFNLDHACSEYGGCGMIQVCKSSSPEDWLPMYFEKRVWDPLSRKEMTVEEHEAFWTAGRES